MPRPAPCRGRRSPLPSRTRISASLRLSFPVTGALALHEPLLVGQAPGPAIQPEVAEDAQSLPQPWAAGDAGGDEGLRAEARLDVPALAEEPLKAPPRRRPAHEPGGEEGLR